MLARLPATVGSLPVLLALLGSGCTLLPAGGRPTAAPGGGPSPMGRGLRDFRVAFHCHSHLSHDSRVPFEEIAATARRLGFNAVITNDHYSVREEERARGERNLNIARSPHGLWDGVLFVPGVEVRPDAAPDGVRERGSLLAFGIERDFPEDSPRVEVMPQLVAGGALVAAGHCEEFRDWDRYPLGAYEVYNLHAQFKRASLWGIAWRFLLYLPDPFFESQVRPDRSVLSGYDAQLARGKRLAPLAGHDAHANVHLFGEGGITIGTYPEVLRLFSNHVLAPALGREGLLEGIRRGHVYISFDFLGDGSGFGFTYGPAEPGADSAAPAPAILGEEAAHRPGSVLRVDAPAEGIIRILRDGQPWQEARGRSFSVPVPGPGIYRVEVDRMDGWGVPRLWIISAPIYLRGGTP